LRGEGKALFACQIPGESSVFERGRASIYEADLARAFHAALVVVVVVAGGKVPRGWAAQIAGEEACEKARPSIVDKSFLCSENEACTTSENVSLALMKLRRGSFLLPTNQPTKEPTNDLSQRIEFRNQPPAFFVHITRGADSHARVRVRGSPAGPGVAQEGLERGGCVRMAWMGRKRLALFVEKQVDVLRPTSPSSRR